MYDSSIRRKKQVSGISPDLILLCNGNGIVMPIPNVLWIVRSSIHLYPYIDKMRIEKIPSFFLRKNIPVHILARPAPGGKAIHKDILLFRLGLCLDLVPGKSGFKLDTAVLGVRPKRQGTDQANTNTANKT